MLRGFFGFTHLFFILEKPLNDDLACDRNGSVKISVMDFKNIYIKLFYSNNANNQESDVFKKCTPKVQKWIYFNV